MCVTECVWSSPLAAHYKFETGVATKLCQRLFNYRLALSVYVCVCVRALTLRTKAPLTLLKEFISEH